MPIIARLFDGTQLRFPDDTPQEVIDRVAKEQTLERQPQEDQGILRSVEDVSLQIGSGAARGVRGIADAFGADNMVSQAAGGVEKYLDNLLSAQSKNDQKEVGRIMDEAKDKGVGDQLMAALRAYTVSPLDMTARSLGTAVPNILGGVGAKVLGLGTTAVRGVSSGIGAIMGAGMAKGEIYETVKSELLNAKVPEAEAEKAAQRAQSYNGGNLDQIGLSSVLGAIGGSTGIESRIISQLRGSISKNLAKKGIGDFSQTVVTEAAVEGAQGSQEQIAKNLALQREGFDVPTMRGAVGSGALDAIAGGGLGAAVSIAAGKPKTADSDKYVAPPEASPERRQQLEQEQESADIMLERDRAQANVLGKTANAEGQFDLNLAGGKRAPAPKTSLQGTPVPARQAGFDAFGRPVKDAPDLTKPNTAVDQTPITQTFDAQFDLKQLDEESARLDSQKIASPTTPEDRALNKQIAERQKQIKVLQSNIDELKLTPYKGETTKAVVPDTVLTPKALADIGLSKGAGYTNSLKNLDMSLPEDRTKAANVIGSALNNPRLSDEVKSNLQGLYDSKVSQGTVEGQGQLDFQPIEEYNAQTSNVTPELLDTLGIGKTSALRKNASLYETDLSTPEGRKFFTTVLEAYSDAPKRNPAIQQRIGTYLEGLSAQDIEQDVVGDLNVTEPTTEGLVQEPTPATEPALERQAIEPSLELDTVGDATTTPQAAPTEGVGQTELTGLADVTGEPTRDIAGSEQQLDTLTEQPQDNPLESVPPAKIDAVDTAQLAKAPIETATSSGMGVTRAPFENFDQAYAQGLSKGFRVNSDLIETADYADWLGSLTPEQKNIIAPSFTKADNPFLNAGAIDIAETKSKFEKLLAANAPAPKAEYDGYSLTEEEIKQNELDAIEAANKKKYEARRKQIEAEEKRTGAYLSDVGVDNEDASPLQEGQSGYWGRMLASQDNAYQMRLDEYESAREEAFQTQAEAEIDAGPIGQAIAKIENGEVETKAKVRALATKLEKNGTLDDIEDVRDGLSDREQSADDVLDTLNSQLDEARDNAISDRVDELRDEAEAADNQNIPTNEDDPVPTLANSVTRLRAQGVFAGNVSTGLTDAIDAGDTTGALNEIINNDQAQFAPLEKLVAKAMANLSGFKPTIRIVDTLGEDSKGNIRLGVYDPVSDTIQLVNGTADSQTFLHEMTHAFTHRLIQMQERDGITIPAMRDLSEVFNHIKQVRPDLLTEYNADTLTEFAAQVMSAPDLQYELMGIPYKQVSLFVQFARAVGKLFGLDSSSKEHNALLASIVSVDGLMGRGRALQQLARGQKLDDIEVAYTTQMAQSINTPAGKLTPMALSNVASAPTQATRTAKFKFLSAAAKSDASFMERFRQKIADVLVPVSKVMGPEYANNMRNAAGELDPTLFMRQAYDTTKITSSMFKDGAIRISKNGLWESYALKDADGNPVSAQQTITKIVAYGEKEGLGYEATSAKASTIFEALRMDDIRKFNAGIESQAKGLASTGDAQGAYDLRKTKKSGHMLNAEIDAYMKVYEASPDLKEIKKSMDTTMHAMIDALVESGRISSKTATAWKSASNYIPFERLKDVFDNPDNFFTKSRTGVAALKQFKGFDGSFDRPVTNTIDSHINKLASMASEAINNSAAVRTLSSMADIGYATHLKSASDASNSTLVLPKLYVGGQPALFEVDNEHMFIAFSQSPEILSDAVKLMGVFARTLRAGVTLSPEYVIRQVVTDAQRAAFSGVDNRLEVAARSLINFPSSWFSLAFNKETKFMRDLRQKGVIGDIDYNPVNTTELLLYDTKAVQRSPIGAVVHRLEQVTKASDIAARLAVYEQTIKETGDVSLAEIRARELINFNRRGSSKSIRTLAHAVPFFNTTIQSMDLLYRMVNGTDAPSGLSKNKARSMFFKTIGMASALGFIYAASMSDDEGYKEESDEVRDRNWILPKYVRDTVGIDRIPVAPELAFVFKSIPERIVQQFRDSAKGEAADVSDMVLEYLSDAAFMYGSMPIPTVIKPALENMTNYSLFTRRSLVPVSMRDLPAGLQFSGGTSEVARDLGSALNISPIKIDNLVRGYFGSIGSAVLSMGNIILNPNRADRTLNQLPLASVFTLPLTGTRNKDAFYRLREDVMQAVNGAKKLRYNSTDLQQFIDKNGHLMNAEGYIRGKLKTASLIRGQRTQIQEYQGADISSAKKRELLDELDKIELELYADVPSVAAQIRNMSK